MKALMDLLGMAGGPVRPPLTDVDEKTAAMVASLAPRFQAWQVAGVSAARQRG
jgi:dihydrodipicolinate synthase/N-acetylneuraminate lyase